MPATIATTEDVEKTIAAFTRLDQRGDKRAMNKLAQRLQKEQPFLLQHAADRGRVARGGGGRDRAAAEGMNKIADILVDGLGHGSPTADQLPHVHPDHSLSLALERMGASGLNVLPVVSRANVRQLLGIVVLDDILHTYGVTKRNNPESEAKSP